MLPSPEVSVDLSTTDSFMKKVTTMYRSYLRHLSKAVIVGIIVALAAICLDIWVVELSWLRPGYLGGLAGFFAAIVAVRASARETKRLQR
jgi:ABC-type proline/glycine betaine transport system permease subunit